MADPSAEWASQFVDIVKSELSGAYTTQAKIDAAEQIVKAVDAGLKRAGINDVSLELKTNDKGETDLVVAAKSYASLSGRTTTTPSTTGSTPK